MSAYQEDKDGFSWFLLAILAIVVYGAMYIHPLRIQDRGEEIDRNPARGVRSK